MNAQDTRIQQMLKIRRTTLGFGVVQILLGISLTALSFTAFAFTSSDRIRNACPYWAGFTVFCSGGVGIIAWKNSSVISLYAQCTRRFITFEVVDEILSLGVSIQLKAHECFIVMSLFTFFSAVCVGLQMIGTILTGDAGGLLKSLVMCEKQISGHICKCCDSIAACRHSAGGIEFEGVDDCSTLTGLLSGLMYGLCVLTIFGSFLCFVATILGCTAVARETSRNQGPCSRQSSRRSHTSNQERYDTWTSYPTDLSTLPSYAPPVYHSVENFQEYGLSSCIVPPPVFDPTDLPPPYSSQNPSLAESQYSLSSPESSTSQHQLSAGQELMELCTSLRSAIHDPEPNVERNEAAATCSTPTGVIDLDGGDLPWDEQVCGVSQVSEIYSASGTSCLSGESTNRNFPGQEDHQRDHMNLSGHETGRTENRNVVPFASRHASRSNPKLQKDLPGILPECARSKVRASSLGTADDVSSVTQVIVHPITTSSSSPVRRTTILSLHTRCSSLGENSIYVNSFEVLARPPPNMRVPSADEPCKPFTTDSDLNTRNDEECLHQGDALQGDAVIENHRNGRSEQKKKERGKHRRRRHPRKVPKQKEKRDIDCELPNSQVNCAHKDPIPSGKETVV